MRIRVVALANHLNFSISNKLAGSAYGFVGGFRSQVESVEVSGVEVLATYLL